MEYEINVSLKGQHFFATHRRSIKTQEELLLRLVLFIGKFPESEGYEITVGMWETKSFRVDIPRSINTMKISKDKRTLYERLKKELERGII